MWRVFAIYGERQGGEMADQFLDLIYEAEAHRHTITLWPARWNAYNSPAALQWEEFSFRTSSKGKIPNKPGVYAFSIRPGIGGLYNSVLMYIGKTDRTLRARFGEYLREAQNASARPQLYRMLQQYKQHLTFSCAALDPPLLPTVVEDALLGALIPPVNSTLPASVSRIVSAFQ